MVIAYFTPATGFIGGALVGLSAATLLLLSGDILGASGLVSSTLLSPRKTLSDPTVTWKLAFLSTFLLISNTVLGASFSDDARLGEDPSIPIISVVGYLLGGLFVGFGTRMGNGCTTGHGICGMARLSKRSTVAVCAFMVSALATATLTAPDNKAFSKGTEFLRTDTVPDFFNRWLGFGISMPIVLPTLYLVYKLFWLEPAPSQEDPSDQLPQKQVTEKSERTLAGSTCNTDGFHLEEEDGVEVVGDVESPPQGKYDVRQKVMTAPPTVTTCSRQEAPEDIISESRRKILPAALAACIFAVGLAVSGMVLPSKVLGFLNLLLFAQGSYDPTLLTVMAGGCFVSFISYQFVKGWGLFPNPYARECPLLTKSFSVPTNQVLDGQLIGGALCFGIGWGIAGICPGPAIFLAATGAQPVICYWWPAFFAGSFVAQKIKEKANSCTGN